MNGRRVENEELSTHAHDYRKPRRIDQCHYMLIVSTCACGATHEVEQERDFEEYPLSIAFAREDCARCREILSGCEPASWARGGQDGH